MDYNLPTVEITLNTFHQKKDGTFPLKLRITHERKPRYFAIKIILPDFSEIDSLTPDQLNFALGRPVYDIEGNLVTKGSRDIRLKQIGAELNKQKDIATNIIKKLDPFTFESFRDEFSGKHKTTDNEPGNVFLKYEKTIQELTTNNQLGSASSYDLSLKSLKAFIKHDKGKEPLRLYFKDITVSWLRKYETYMTSDKTTLQSDGNMKIKPGLSETTVGFYLRALRAVFHRAITDKEIDPGVYPFGSTDKKLYQIPTGDNVKKALTKDDLKKLFNAIAPTPQQEKARDFFFFSYQCNGLNIKDICNLKNSNLDTDSFSFYRAKTKHTTKKPKLIKVMLTDYSKTIITKYRNKDTSPTAYVFPVLSPTDTEKMKRDKVQNFTSLINQQIKKLAVSVGLTSDISTYFARHSFATLAIQGGASIEFISQSLGHSDTKTTQNYFAGFQDSTHKNILESLMDF